MTSFTVSVTGNEVNSNNAIKVKNVIYTENLGTGDIWGMHFKVEWNPLSVGLEYISDWKKEIQNIELQDDWIYIVAFSEWTCWKCNDFIPFAQDSSKTYYAEQKVFAFNYNDDNIGVANSDGIEINSQWYQDFQKYFNFIWYNKGYSDWVQQTKQKIVDIKDSFYQYSEAKYFQITYAGSYIIGKVIEINDQIPYEVFIDIWEKLRLAGTWAIAIWSIVCISWVEYAAVYTLNTDGALIIPWFITLWTCWIGASIIWGWAVIWWVWFLMEWSGKIWKATQWTWWKPPKWSKQDKELSKWEIQKLKDMGIDIHDLKPKKNWSYFDLFKDKNGDIYFKRKTGHISTEPQYTWFNINNF